MILTSLFATRQAQAQSFSKTAYFDAMASNNLESVTQVLDTFTGNQSTEKTGYEGALLMKKAGLLHKAKEKLAVFKAGRIKLETALTAEPANTELHFLRLIIQEQAPRVVKYRSNIKDDAALVAENFKHLSPTLQQAVADYSKISKTLKPDELALARN